MRHGARSRREPKDEDLVVRAQQGDERAFEALTVSHHPRLYRVSLSILRDPTHAEDATQAAIIGIWRYLPRLREPAKSSSWSYKILVRACATHLKTTPRWIPQSALPPTAEPWTLDAVGVIADRERIEHAFARLSLDHRAVIVLRYLLDLPQDEIAASLDVSVGTVKSRLHRATKALRSALEADDRPSIQVNRARASER